MSVSPLLLTSLKAVGKVMAGARDPWWIIASAAVALHGADAGHVADVDVLLSAADAQCILPTIGVRPRQGSMHPTFRSGVLATWSGRTPLLVEFMADFAHWSGAAWLPVKPATRQRVDIAGVMLFVPKRAELQALLTDFGRPNDLQRARSLAASL